MSNKTRHVVEQDKPKGTEPFDLSLKRKNHVYLSNPTLGVYVRKYGNKVRIPDSQRSNVWPKANKSEYMMTLLFENPKNDIVFNDIKSSSLVDDDYLEYLEQGYHYELCDGYNRHNTILEFFEGKVSFPKEMRKLHIMGTNYDFSECTYTEILKNKGIKQEVKDFFTDYLLDEIEMSVKILKDMTGDDVSAHMIALNKSMPWHEQNFRMVYDTDVTKLIRKYLKDHDMMQFSRYNHETKSGIRASFKLDRDNSFLFTTLLYFIERNSVRVNVTAAEKSLDDFHKLGTIRDIEESTKRIKTITDVLSEYSLKVKFKTAFCHDLYMATEILRVEGYDIVDTPLFAKYFLSRDKWRKDETGKLSLGSGKYITAYKQLMDGALKQDSLSTRYTVIKHDILQDIGNGVDFGVKKVRDSIGHNPHNINIKEEDERNLYTKGFVFGKKDTPEALNSEYFEENEVATEAV